ncbi:MAG: hypothetical protein RSE13_01035 [Planktothrix sp. GU0601_MAG3]|nr:MAG: hypothetical protein RSE13_01035 [Planktothrix sp. GU0601_MAG3]
MLPKNGIEMYQQRLFALHKSRIYTNLYSEIDQPNYQDWLDILKQESDLIQDKIAKNPDSSRLNILLGDSLSMWFPNSLLPSGNPMVKSRYFRRYNQWNFRTSGYFC